MSARSEGTVLLEGRGGPAERRSVPWPAALIVLGVVAASALGGYLLATTTAKNKPSAPSGSVQALPALASGPSVRAVRPIGSLPALALPAKPKPKPKPAPAPVLVRPTPRPTPAPVVPKPHSGGTVTVISEPQ